MCHKFLLQLLDLISLRLDFGCHQLADCAQLSGVFGQGFEGCAHSHFISGQPSERNAKMRKTHVLLAYPACNGRHVRCGVRQSMPSSEGVWGYPLW
jgi:hypothetical protein